ncbi:hypothetical protein CASFOL_009415 [Castilleja foliolosa]|uniref:MGRN1/RNF157-like N-terminal domain-containing protein n=1 Tax=Castilleja foliolosa TaxID=1961234 RepID=A0ABD3E1C8_9LAMI
MPMPLPAPYDHHHNPAAAAHANWNDGLHKRERNFSLLSFGVDPKINFETEAKSDDASQVLSALLPFVVALTSVAALSKPSTFTWVSKELYAPALGGIMLSIGIGLSIDDFSLAFKSDFLKKETLKIVPDEGNPGKYLVTFTFDATVAGRRRNRMFSRIAVNTLFLLSDVNDMKNRLERDVLEFSNSRK